MNCFGAARKSWQSVLVMLCLIVSDSRERGKKKDSRESMKRKRKRLSAPPRDTLALHSMLPPMVYANCEWRIPRVLFHFSHKRPVLAKEHLANECKSSQTLILNHFNRKCSFINRNNGTCAFQWRLVTALLTALHHLHFTACVCLFVSSSAQHLPCLRSWAFAAA